MNVLKTSIDSVFVMVVELNQPIRIIEMTSNNPKQLRVNDHSLRFIELKTSSAIQGIAMKLQPFSCASATLRSASSSEV